VSYKGKEKKGLSNSWKGKVRFPEEGEGGRKVLGRYSTLYNVLKRGRTRGKERRKFFVLFNEKKKR